MSGFRNQVLTRVIIGGSGSSGLFLYNGSPGPGNPPVLAAVSPGVVKDPFGNTLKAVLNIGNFAAAHIGWDVNGNTFVSDNAGNTRVLITGGGGNVWPGGTDPAVVFYNSAGAIILVVDPARGGTFQYQDLGTSSQGVLIGAQVGKNTTDPVNGTTVLAGVNLIDPAFGDTMTIVGAIINFKQVSFTKNAIDTANTGSTNQGPFRSLAAPEQTQAGHVVQRWYGTSPDGTRAAGSVISLTDPPTRQTAELLEVQGTALVSLLKAWHPGGVTTEETWQAAGLAAGYGNGTPAPRFQLEPIGGGRVRLDGQVNLTANQLAGATIFTLSAGYRPANDHFFSVPSNLSGGFNNGFILKVQGSTGAVQQVIAGTNGNTIVLDGVVVPLD